MNKPITIMPLNEFHMDHKVRMQSTDLDLLKSASFEDASFHNEFVQNFLDHQSWENISTSMYAP